MSDSYVKGKDKNQVLSDLVGVAGVGSEVHEQLKSAILVRCTEDIEAAVSDLRSSVDGAASATKNSLTSL